MAYSIDYSDPAQYVIRIPRADMLLLQSTPVEIRELNLNTFRFSVVDLQDDSDGIWAPTAVNHVAPITAAGVTLARVVEILEPYVIEFEDGLYNVNVLGGNTNLSDRTIKNQVGVNTSNSAGLQDPFALQAAEYAGEVALSGAATITGTVHPFGTRRFPVNNVADALQIASERGIRQIRVLDDFAFSTGDFSSGYLFIGDHPNVSVTLAPGPNVEGCEFKNLTIDGTLDGNNTLRECVVRDIEFFNGFLHCCGLVGTVTLGGTVTATMLNCFSLVPNGSSGQPPRINLAGTQVTPLVVHDYYGDLALVDCSDQQAAASIDMSSGRVIFESSVSDGSFTVRGVAADVVDNSTGTAVVIDKTVDGGSASSPTEIAAAVWLVNASASSPAGSRGEQMGRIELAATRAGSLPPSVGGSAA